ncbi:hypothetical protein BCV72DRAFT_66514 [Rhizopus microsporus var. microsporus]|uniref:C2H2-type domain-containing protein n=2 Tax=Rhizopus microsporus TaxID=58291 RepID=A0A2G4SHU9_RHIZD|nr:uncharacterized protein RHIMIDRAFT_241833 [Rhizopus microsporus ATCC 52813]ORE09300.1 hypothetical protein BCV72DRAFT_66514 [Rhizopus microsporus var. microsporus]PHZ08319.1 hypothetical protein RHIMIDRAFT_241833 [Rhizopus microsporus ATCC 52813]
MAEDTEWHTVSNHKHATHHPTSPPQNRNRRQSKPKIHSHQTATGSNSGKDKKPANKTSESGKPQASKSATTHSKKHSHGKKPQPKRSTSVKKPAASRGKSNPFHAAEQDEESEEEDAEGHIDPIDLPVPPYHTTTFVTCPFDNCETPAPFLDTTSLVTHLKQAHKLVFKNLHHMYNSLDAYLQQWAKELENKPLEEYGQTDPQEEGIYIISPEKCSLDKEMREKINRTKLNEVLKFQQHEREVESKCPRKCLFCKIVGEDRTSLFKHMFSEHNFNIGLPDNLVYVTEFLDTLEAKLSNLQCLYCEKIFTSPAVLRKHMRKKKHFKVAAKNRQYDRFYVINYLEPGKNWESFEREAYESEDDDKREETWDDWEEDEPESTMCLFDTTVLSCPKDILEHMKTEHEFNLSQIRKDKGLDFYQTIVLINYIRHQSSLNTCFSCGSVLENLSDLPAHLKENKCITKLSTDAEFWKDPKYLMPTYENDPLLTGFEEDDNNLEEEDLLEISEAEANKKFLHQVMEKSLSISDDTILDNK